MSNLQKLKAYAKYFKTICRHKHYVFIECCKHRIPIQGLLHDLSKFLPTEFFASALYFNGGEVTEERMISTGYYKAWAHHKAHNKHHWEYWTDYDGRKPVALPMPKKYIVEMYCDLVGAGKAYGGDDAYKYFVKHWPTWIITEETEKQMVELLGRTWSYWVTHEGLLW